MLNIHVAIRVWALNWASKHLHIFCDNEAVLSVLNTGKTKDALLATIARNIFMASAKHDISFKFTHVAGKLNVVADSLSHWQNTQKLQVLVLKFKWVDVEAQYFHIDADI